MATRNSSPRHTGAGGSNNIRGAELDAVDRRILRVLADDARVPNNALAERGIRGSHAVVRTDGAQLAQIARLIDAGKVVAHVSEIQDLRSAAAAQDLNEKGRTRGKIVLRVP